MYTQNDEKQMPTVVNCKLDELESQGSHCNNADTKLMPNNYLCYDSKNWNNNNNNSVILCGTGNTDKFELMRSCPALTVDMPYLQLEALKENNNISESASKTANHNSHHNTSFPSFSHISETREGTTSRASICDNTKSSCMERSKIVASFNPHSEVSVTQSNYREPFQLIAANLCQPLNYNTEPIFLVANSEGVIQQCNYKVLTEISNHTKEQLCAGDNWNIVANNMSHAADKVDRYTSANQAVIIPTSSAEHSAKRLIPLAAGTLSSVNTANNVLNVSNNKFTASSSVLTPNILISNAGKDNLHFTRKDEVISVVDPQRRKLNIPLSAIHLTKALNERVTAPSLCLLYQAGHCRQGSNCYQIHADPVLINKLRLYVENLPCCCAMHGDCNGQMWNGKPHKLKYVIVANKYIVPFIRLAYTNGLYRLLDDNTEHIAVNTSLICRTHDQPHGCRFGADCKFLHICRELLHNEMKEIVELLLVNNNNINNNNNSDIADANYNHLSTFPVKVEKTTLNICDAKVGNRSDAQLEFPHSLIRTAPTFDNRFNSEAVVKANMNSVTCTNVFYPHKQQGSDYAINKECTNICGDAYASMNSLRNIGDRDDAVFTQANSSACVQDVNSNLSMDNAMIGIFDTSSPFGLNLPVNKQLRGSLTTIATNDSASQVNGLSTSFCQSKSADCLSKDNTVLNDAASSEVTPQNSITSYIPPSVNWDVNAAQPTTSLECHGIVLPLHNEKKINFNSSNNQRNNNLNISDNVVFSQTEQLRQTLAQNILPRTEETIRTQELNSLLHAYHKEPARLCEMTENKELTQQKYNIQSSPLILQQQQQEQQLYWLQQNNTSPQTIKGPICNAERTTPLQFQRQVIIDNTSNPVNMYSIIRDQKNVSFSAPLLATNEHLNDMNHLQLSNAPTKMQNANSLFLAAMPTNIVAKGEVNVNKSQYLQHPQQKIESGTNQQQPSIQEVYPQYVLQRTNPDGSIFFTPVNFAI